MPGPCGRLDEGALSAGDQPKEHVLEELIGETAVLAERAHRDDRLTHIERITPRRVPRSHHRGTIETGLGHEALQLVE